MNRLPARWIAAAVLLAAPEVRALTFLDLATGDEGLFPDARSVALGRTRIGQGAGAFTAAASPARLAWTERWIVSAGGGVHKLKETRSTPAFDSFDGFLVESIYALNDKIQSRGGIGVALPVGRSGLPGRLGIGVSFRPVRDFQYDYSEEVRDNNAFTQPRDRLIALNEVQSDGTLDGWTFAAGWSPHRVVAVGAGLEVLSGRQDLLQRTRFVQQETAEVSSVKVRSLSGERGVFSLALRPGHRVDAAVTFRTEATVEGAFLRQGDVDWLAWLAPPSDPTRRAGRVRIRYPREVGVGLAWRPRARVRSTVRLDARWTEWSRFEHGLWDLSLEDVWDVRFGIEHVFYNGFPVRFGFHYRPSPRNDEVATTAFTFGGGVDLGLLRADLGFEVAVRDYRFPDLFDDAVFGGSTRTEKDLVDESTVTAYGTVTWSPPGVGG